jgi:hypothetical protein
VEVVPDTYHFTHGALKLIQFSSVIPFSGKLYLPYLNLDYTNTADFLSDVLISRDRTSAQGVGTNVISDGYVEFGVAGVVILLFALGLFAKAMRNYVTRDPYDPYRVVMYLLTLSSFAELPRYAIDSPIRLLAWAFIFSVLTGAVRFRSRAPAQPIARKVVYERRKFARQRRP